MRLSATEILRRHAIERYMRAGIRSVTLDEDRGGPPRMSESAWVTSCLLVRGVPALVLDVLGVRECEAEESTWCEEALEVMGVATWVPTSQVARPLSLVQAAARLGLALEYEQLKQMRQAALAVVTENLLARRVRERGVAA
jgi:hypothetical protein